MLEPRDGAPERHVVLAEERGCRLEGRLVARHAPAEAVGLGVEEGWTQPGSQLFDSSDQLAGPVRLTERERRVYRPRERLLASLAADPGHTDQLEGGRPGGERLVQPALRKAQRR